MTFGICLQSIAALRSEPSHRSEQVSQILFGELFTIIVHDKDWVRVRLSYDNYEGWVHRKQVTELSESEFLRLLNTDTPTCTDLVQLLSNETAGTVIPLLLGSSLPGLHDGKFIIQGQTYLYDGAYSFRSTRELMMPNSERIKIKQELVKEAMIYLNAPYFWGGRSPFGIDCSGLTQMIYKMKQVRILRDASQQSSIGEPLGFVSEAEPGDLAFFDDEEGLITHVGMIIDKQNILHASGKVRIDKIDHEGIYNEEEQRYTHKLRIIKRIL
ncbi:MAG: NlpC/P60 family protein [Syntrophothermus sp.]